MKKTLKKIGLVLFGAAWLAAADIAVRTATTKKHKLTPGQIENAQKMFGDKIDYSKVRIYEAPFSIFQKKDRYTAIGNNIYCPTGGSYAELIESDIVTHELVHVWQRQNNIKNTGIVGVFNVLTRHKNYNDAYPYVTDSTKRLTDYNFEQQGDIVQNLNRILNALEKIQAARDSADWLLDWPSVSVALQASTEAINLQKIASSHLPVKLPAYVTEIHAIAQRRDAEYKSYDSMVESEHLYYWCEKIAKKHGTPEMTPIGHRFARMGLWDRKTWNLTSGNVSINLSAYVDRETGTQETTLTISENKKTVMVIKNGDYFNTLEIFSPGTWLQDVRAMRSQMESGKKITHSGAFSTQRKRTL